MAHSTPAEQPPPTSQQEKPSPPETYSKPEKRWLPITLAALGGAAVAAVAATAITAGAVRSISAGRPVPVPSVSATSAPHVTAAPPSSSSSSPTLAPQQANTATCTAYDRAADLIREAQQAVPNSPATPAADLYNQAAARIAAPTITPGTTPALAAMAQSLSTSLTALAEFTATADPNTNEVRVTVDAAGNALSILCQRLAPGR